MVITNTRAASFDCVPASSDRNCSEGSTIRFRKFSGVILRPLAGFIDRVVALYHKLQSGVEMVVVVSYLTWTEGGLLRAVSYQGQREDKPAKQVVRSAPIRR